MLIFGNQTISFISEISDRYTLFCGSVIHEILPLSDLKENFSSLEVLVYQILWLVPVIPATCELEIRRLKVQSQPRLKVSQNHPPLHLSQTSWVCLHMPVIPAMCKA
jgi:hypothetical protein